MKTIKKMTGLIAFFVLWQICATIADHRVFPSPLHVASAIQSHWKPLTTHTLYSVWRLVVGTLLSVGIGVPVGILTGYYRKPDAFLSPVINFLGPIPKIALLPLIMLLMGVGNLSKIFIIFVVIVFQIIISVRDCVSSIPAEYFLPFRTVRARGTFILMHVVIPAALPAMFTALRVGLATGISVLFFAETFGTRRGLGFYIMDMWMRLDYRQMYAGILVMGVIGLLSVTAVDRMEKRICRWNRNI